VKLNPKHIWLLLLVLGALLPGAGCGGLSATKSVSPLDFLIPGGLLYQPDLRQNLTNNITPSPQPSRQLALAQ
jgi:hypothetical protein